MATQQTGALCCNFVPEPSFLVCTCWVLLRAVVIAVRLDLHALSLATELVWPTVQADAMANINKEKYTV